ncbi:MAG: NAD(P)-dependent oxidoreductase [Rikenellaceae bacterium]
MKRVLVTYNMFKDGYAELRERYDVTFPPEGVESFTYEEVKSMIGEYDALQSMFNFPVDRELMDVAPRLQIISNYAVGYDNVDVDYATSRGILVTNTPDPVTEPTADQALGLMLATMRRISEIDSRLRRGDVEVALLNNLGHSLYGATLGIIGMGRIGEALAGRAVACGMRVVYHNRKALSAQREAEIKARYVTMEELLTQSDVVSVNAPHTPATHHILGREEFAKMKSTAVVINTARGPLVDELALIEALRGGEIWGAGLDVFEFGDYPSPELLEMENVVLSPHLGTQTIEVRHEMARHVSRNIINLFEGVGHIDNVNTPEGYIPR